MALYDTEEAHLQPSAPKHDQKQEKPNNSPIERLIARIPFLVKRNQTEARKEHRDGLSDRTPQEHFSTTERLDHGVRGEC